MKIAPNTMKQVGRHIVAFAVSACVVLPLVTSAQIVTSNVSSSLSLGSYDHVAPGESLPVNVQLLNFGTPGEQVDVSIHLGVLDQAGDLVLERTETVAVQTTAAFTRYLPIPKNFQSGSYLLVLDVRYGQQRFPAIAEQTFTVERKIFGYFVSDWLTALPFAVIPLTIVALFYRRRHFRVSDYDRNYEGLENDRQFYYEIIHDVLRSLHYHVGDKKMKRIVSSIPGLLVDNEERTRVLKVDGNPSEIVSALIRHYEHETGKKVNLAVGVEGTANRIV